MPLPEYGRSVQKMVDHCLTIQDRAQRQLCAETIIQIMEDMFPAQKGVEDFQHKLWDHLAMMAQYQLDIDYPFEIIPQVVGEKPQPLPYESEPIKYRHYGKLLEHLLAALPNYPEGPERVELVRQTVQQMKRSMSQWNVNGADDAKILQDLLVYTKGTVQATPDMLQFDNRAANNNNGGKKSNNKKRRK